MQKQCLVETKTVKKRVIISACLLGENCRYDGKSKKINEIIEAFSDYEIIPFCPEAPVFGTPRQRISVIRLNGENRIITDETNEDVTQVLADEIELFMQKNSDIEHIVLKARSPSCGLGTTPVLNEQKEIVEFSDAIAAKMFKKHYKNTKIEDEKAFI